MSCLEKREEKQEECSEEAPKKKSVQEWWEGSRVVAWGRKRGKGAAALWGQEKLLGVLWVLLLLACVMLLLSILRIWGITGSFAGWLAENLPGVYGAVRKIVNIDAVIKAGETIGFSSFIVVWLYSALDREELGFRYSELLEEKHLSFHMMVPMHLTAFIVCMWMAKLGKLEAASWAICVVFLTNIMQWIAMRDLVLISEKRKEAAMRRWERLIGEREGDALKATVYNMVLMVRLDGGSGHEGMEKLLGRAVDKWLKKEAEAGIKAEDWKYILLELADMWERMMKDRQEEERRIIAAGVLWGCPEEVETPDRAGAMCAGYILWFCKERTKKSMPLESERMKAAEEIVRERDVLAQKLKGREKLSIYINEAATVMLWMYWLCGLIEGDRSFFNGPWPSQGGYEKVLRGLGQAAFVGDSVQKNLETAIARTVQCKGEGSGSAERGDGQG